VRQSRLFFRSGRSGKHSLQVKMEVRLKPKVDALPFRNTVYFSVEILRRGMQMLVARVRKARAGWRRRLVQIGTPVLVLYCVLLAGFDYAMHQPPETFSRVMMHVGPVPFLLFPFETMWKNARTGHLRIDDNAPDFTLPLLDHSGSVTVSSFRGTMPVVLVFGSYT